MFNGLCAAILTRISPEYKMGYRCDNELQAGHTSAKIQRYRRARVTNGKLIALLSGLY
jgi:hypothetical protein